MSNQHKLVSFKQKPFEIEMKTRRHIYIGVVVWYGVE